MFTLTERDIWCAKIFEQVMLKVAEKKKTGDSDIFLSKTAISDIYGSNRRTVEGCIDYIVNKANDRYIRSDYEQRNPGSKFPLGQLDRPALKLHDLQGNVRGVYVDPEVQLNSIAVRPLDDLRRVSLFDGLYLRPVEALRNMYYESSEWILQSLFGLE